MALILNIETSTEVCSVSLAKNGELISIEENTEGLQHAKLITLFIREVFQKSTFSIDQLDAVAISKGPGSYTGLRIGVSTAKGIAYAADIPLIAISTLQALAFGVSSKPEVYYDDDTLFCPMIDARRMEVYTAFFDTNNKQTKEIAADIINENSYQDTLANHKVMFFGNGATKCENIIQSANAIFLEELACSAKDMIKLSEKAFIEKQFVDVAYFEPFYLKDFVATVPRKNIFK